MDKKISKLIKELMTRGHLTSYYDHFFNWGYLHWQAYGISYRILGQADNLQYELTAEDNNDLVILIRNENGIFCGDKSRFMEIVEESGLI